MLLCDAWETFTGQVGLAAHCSVAGMSGDVAEENVASSRDAIDNRWETCRDRDLGVLDMVVPVLYAHTLSLASRMEKF